jgi:hypothetical protein
MQKTARASAWPRNGFIPLMMRGMLAGTISSRFIANHLTLFGACVLSAILILSCTLLTAKLQLRDGSENKRETAPTEET